MTALGADILFSAAPRHYRLLLDITTSRPAFRFCSQAGSFKIKVPVLGVLEAELFAANRQCQSLALSIFFGLRVIALHPFSLFSQNKQSREVQSALLFLRVLLPLIQRQPVNILGLRAAVNSNFLIFLNRSFFDDFQRSVLYFVCENVLRLL